MSRNLVIYYSRRGQNYVGGRLEDLEVGNAERIAGFIRDAVGADLFEIQPVREYSSDYMKCTEEAKEEQRMNERPELREYLDDVDDYDNIFVVGPCWWGTYPMPMFTQLERLDFRKKKVLPLMTHEGSGLGSAERDLKRTCSGAKVAKGLAVQGSKTLESAQEVADWAVRGTRGGRTLR